MKHTKSDYIFTQSMLIGPAILIITFTIAMLNLGQPLPVITSLVCLCVASCVGLFWFSIEVHRDWNKQKKKEERRLKVSNA